MKQMMMIIIIIIINNNLNCISILRKNLGFVNSNTETNGGMERIVEG